METSFSQTLQMTIRSSCHVAIFSRLTTIVLCLLLIPETLALSAQDLDRVVAKVGQVAITQGEVDESITGQIYALQEQIYALRKTALDNLIVQRLLTIEAAKRKLTVEQLKVLWMSGTIPVNRDNIDEVYRQNFKAFGLMNSDEAREKIRLDLESQLRLKSYREQLARLRETTDINLLLEPPRMEGLSRQPSAAINGSSQGRIKLIEFSDFQCIYCKQIQPTIQQLLREFPNDLRLEFRHYPLPIHPLATSAAQASYCAARQNKFWEFHDRLFAVDDLSDPGLFAVAEQLRLNLELFRACLNSSDAISAVISDTSLASRIGITGTPTFILNGRLLRGPNTFEQFKREILTELKTLETNPRNLNSTSLSH